ncbi:23S rRNA (adenine(1618)-N(6))-methyltransferase RlmF [Neptunomonas antarctica]|uniref:Ribosomal RNA large subunit methyltransferase F n=1 Tax=Neptunomonas antarctica TaxID=619304 RepID=A0A1N7K1R6_9GAMM|nr:23S rRNA (adenine(1618)-N(6))-methyltransferase RlmF [Neptunomonas antarctica]SIS55539.1 23S rRNA m(6)A-1618 methyltransferase [Neptunomonas antarctica]
MSTVLHPRNPHQGRYDLEALSNTCPELKLYLRPNPKGDNTVDFSDENAVLCLNKALLAHYYHVAHWQIPAGYLCPPIPGRADYIHYSADLLAECNQGQWPTGKRVNVLDVGAGANCIYPIIGSQSYGWQFVGTDIDAVAIKTAQLIVKSNTCLSKHIKLVHQKNSELIFKGVIKENDRFDLTICNPPFHASITEAQAGSHRKWTNLNKGKEKLKSVKLIPEKQGAAKLNFGGQQSELWCPGGELSFLERMAQESVGFSKQVCWFTSLVSKKENVLPLKSLVTRLGAKQCKVVNMSQGQKISRLIVWSFLNPDEQQQWAEERWR